MKKSLNKTNPWRSSSIPMLIFPRQPLTLIYETPMPNYLWQNTYDENYYDELPKNDLPNDKLPKQD